MAAKASMLTPQDAKARVGKVFLRRFPSWASQLAWTRLVSKQIDAADASALFTEDFATPTFESDTLAMPLHPPTETMALHNSSATRSWVEQWRKLGKTLPDGVSLTWSTRHWPSVGTQEVPERIAFETANAIAAFAGKSRQWDCLVARVEKLCTLATENASNDDGASNDDVQTFALSFSEAIRKTSSKIEKLDEDDWILFHAAFVWLIHNPDTFCYIRELPIPGIHTKWIEQNRTALFPIVASITGHTPSFRTPSHQIRVHVLDPSCAPAEMLDFQASPAELSQLTLIPGRVIIVENLTTTLALPFLPNTWALWGKGFAVTELAEIAWLKKIPVFYWGDLDTHGFAILNALRSHVPEVRSILMDAETLNTHAQFCVEEPTPTNAAMVHLTAEETTTCQALSSKGELAKIKNRHATSTTIKHLRLEQERIGWTYALAKIRDELR